MNRVVQRNFLSTLIIKNIDIIISVNFQHYIVYVKIKSLN